VRSAVGRDERPRKGLVIVTACAHRGDVNIVHHAKRITGVDRVSGRSSNGASRSAVCCGNQASAAE
jgi:hypothetical protein